MTELRKAAKMALEVMEYNRANGTPNMGAAMEALRQALAHPEQEPVGYVTDSGASAYFCKGVELDDDTPLYAAPPHYWGNVTSAELVEELRRRDMLMVPVKEQEPYDQTALELCEKCGWKAIISDEGCLVCARNEQEPFIYVREDNERPFGGYEHCSEAEAGAFPVYTAPPKREWVGLTEREARAIGDGFENDKGHIQSWMSFARHIEAKLREKNGG